MKKEVIYHYCSIETFLSILQNCTLRLTDIEKSNDFAERVYMETCIQDELIKLLNKKASNNDIEVFIKDWCQILYESSNLYACCFSEDGDLLSQWRGYADNGFGVSIGFSKNILEERNEEKYGLKFQKVSYNILEHEQFAKKQAQVIEKCLEKKNIYSAIAEVFENNIEINSCMKNPAFVEEKEWRLSIAMNPLLRINEDKEVQDFQMSKIKMYSSKKKIITYLDLNFEKIKQDFVKEIVIGPNCKMSTNDLKQCLSILGYEASKINIIPSKSTYRI